MSPHPPMAIMTLVSGPKRLRIVDTDSNGVNCGGESELNRVEGANAMIACVTPWVLSLPGRLAVWYLLDFQYVMRQR